MNRVATSDKQITKEVKSQTLDILSSLIRTEDESGKAEHTRLRNIWGCNSDKDNVNETIEHRRPRKDKKEKSFSNLSASSQILTGPMSDAIHQELIRLRKLKEELHISFDQTPSEVALKLKNATKEIENKLKSKNGGNKFEFGTHLKDRGLLSNGPTERLGKINGKHATGENRTKYEGLKITMSSSSKVHDKLYADASNRSKLRTLNQEQEQIHTQKSMKKIPKETLVDEKGIPKDTVVDRLYKDAVSRQIIGKNQNHTQSTQSKKSEDMKNNTVTSSVGKSHHMKGISFSKASRTAPVAFFRMPGDVIDDVEFGREIHATSKRYQGGTDNSGGGAVYPSNAGSWWVDKSKEEEILLNDEILRRKRMLLTMVKVSQVMIRFTCFIKVLRDKKGENEMKLPWFERNTLLSHELFLNKVLSKEAMLYPPPQTLKDDKRDGSKALAKSVNKGSLSNVMDRLVQDSQKRELKSLQLQYNERGSSINQGLFNTESCISAQGVEEHGVSHEEWHTIVFENVPNVISCDEFKTVLNDKFITKIPFHSGVGGIISIYDSLKKDINSNQFSNASEGDEQMKNMLFEDNILKEVSLVDDKEYLAIVKMDLGLYHEAIAIFNQCLYVREKTIEKMLLLYHTYKTSHVEHIKKETDDHAVEDVVEGVDNDIKDTNVENHFNIDLFWKLSKRIGQTMKQLSLCFLKHGGRENFKKNVDYKKTYFKIKKLEQENFYHENVFPKLIKVIKKLIKKHQYDKKGKGLFCSNANDMNKYKLFSNKMIGHNLYRRIVIKMCGDVNVRKILSLNNYIYWYDFVSKFKLLTSLSSNAEGFYNEKIIVGISPLYAKIGTRVLLKEMKQTQNNNKNLFTKNNNEKNKTENTTIEHSDADVSGSVNSNTGARKRVSNQQDSNAVERSSMMNHDRQQYGTIIKVYECNEKLKESNNNKIPHLNGRAEVISGYNKNLLIRRKRFTVLLDSQQGRNKQETVNMNHKVNNVKHTQIERAWLSHPSTCSIYYKNPDYILQPFTSHSNTLTNFPFSDAISKLNRVIRKHVGNMTSKLNTNSQHSFLKQMSKISKLSTLKLRNKLLFQGFHSGWICQDDQEDVCEMSSSTTTKIQSFIQDIMNLLPLFVNEKDVSSLKEESERQNIIPLKNSEGTILSVKLRHLLPSELVPRKKSVKSNINMSPNRSLNGDDGDDVDSLSSSLSSTSMYEKNGLTSKSSNNDKGAQIDVIVDILGRRTTAFLLLVFNNLTCITPALSISNNLFKPSTFISERRQMSNISDLSNEEGEEYANDFEKNDDDADDDNDDGGGDDDDDNDDGDGDDDDEKGDDGGGDDDEGEVDGNEDDSDAYSNDDFEKDGNESDQAAESENIVDHLSQESDKPASNGASFSNRGDIDNETDDYLSQESRKFTNNNDNVHVNRSDVDNGGLLRLNFENGRSDMVCETLAWKTSESAVIHIDIEWVNDQDSPDCLDCNLFKTNEEIENALWWYLDSILLPTSSIRTEHTTSHIYEDDDKDNEDGFCGVGNFESGVSDASNNNNDGVGAICIVDINIMANYHPTSNATSSTSSTFNSTGKGNISNKNQTRRRNIKNYAKLSIIGTKNAQYLLKCLKLMDKKTKSDPTPPLTMMNDDSDILRRYFSNMVGNVSMGGNMNSKNGGFNNVANTSTKISSFYYPSSSNSFSKPIMNAPAYSFGKVSKLRSFSSSSSSNMKGNTSLKNNWMLSSGDISQKNKINDDDDEVDSGDDDGNVIETRQMDTFQINEVSDEHDDEGGETKEHILMQTSLTEEDQAASPPPYYSPPPSYDSNDGPLSNSSALGDHGISEFIDIMEGDEGKDEGKEEEDSKLDSISNTMQLETVLLQQVIEGEELDEDTSKGFEETLLTHQEEHEEELEVIKEHSIGNKEDLTLDIPCSLPSAPPPSIDYETLQGKGNLMDLSMLDVQQAVLHITKVCDDVGGSVNSNIVEIQSKKMKNNVKSGGGEAVFDRLYRQGRHKQNEKIVGSKIKKDKVSKESISKVPLKKKDNITKKTKSSSRSVDIQAETHDDSASASSETPMNTLPSVLTCRELAGTLISKPVDTFEVTAREEEQESDLEDGEDMNWYEAVASFYENSGSEWLNNDGWDDISTILADKNEVQESDINKLYGLTLKGNDLSDDNGRGLYMKLQSNGLIGTAKKLYKGLKRLSSPPLSALNSKLCKQNSLDILIELNLSFNSIEGNLKDLLPYDQLSKLEILSLSGNFLSGYIPSELKSLKSLKELYLNSNRLIGTIPKEMKYLSSHLITCSLSHNFLTGNLYNLLLKNADNEVNGEIVINDEGSTSAVDCNHDDCKLEYLDISNNKFKDDAWKSIIVSCKHIFSTSRVNRKQLLNILNICGNNFTEPSRNIKKMLKTVLPSAMSIQT